MTIARIPTALDRAVQAPAPPRLLDRMARRLVRRRLGGLDGLTVREAGAPAPPAPAPCPTAAPGPTVTIHDPRAWRRIATGGSLGAAEAYLRGEWSADDLPASLRVFARSIETVDDVEGGSARLRNAAARVGHAVRRNSRRGSRRNIRDHYDLGNEFFALFLDESLTYSCAIFENGTTDLHDASLAKLDRICRKLDLRPEHHVLEIGTGWGSFALHAAGRYGCRVTTTTISAEQHALAARRVQAAGLADRVTVLQRDYRDVAGTYDRVVSIEMIEAVGHAYLPTFFRACSDRLTDDGLMALQAITMPDHRYDRYRRSTDFIQRHVFPGSCLPSVSAMNAATARATDLRLVHLEEIGPHYATTLRCWRERFTQRLDEVRALGYPERFLRLWDFYLAYCEAGFAEGYIGTVQMTLAKPRCTRSPILSLPGGAARAGGSVLMIGRVLNFVGFQAVWFSCIVGAAAGRPAFGPVVGIILLAVHLTQTRRLRGEAVLIALAAVVGYAADSILVQAGALSFPPEARLGGPSTIWMVMLWMAFAATLNESFAWLHGRYLTGAIIGALAGPLSYWAGSRLGAVDLAAPLPGSLALVAVEWVLSMPLLLLLARVTAEGIMARPLIATGPAPPVENGP